MLEILIIVCTLIVLGCLFLAFDMRFGCWTGAHEASCTIEVNEDGERFLKLDVYLEDDAVERLVVNFPEEKEIDLSVLTHRMIQIQFFRGRVTGLIYSSKLLVGDREILLQQV